MSAFNLVSSAWLPVIRASGRRERVQPAHITNDLAVDPIVDVDFARADFRCATIEFLIGLLTVAYPPRDEWGAGWRNPPSDAELEAAFALFEGVFAFDGSGPRAYQDYEDFAAKPTPVEALLIEAPGAETVRKNAALFVKAERVDVLSISTAALALLTLQTMAPSGGSGHRTSLRGGGPLSTLILPKAPSTLWHRLWANVSGSDQPPAVHELPRIFPWLAPTRLSNKGQVTTPHDVDWRQASFGMPRRIRLNIEPNVDRVPCDLTGEIEDVIVRTYRTLKHGVNYEAWGGVHPLTPHYRLKSTDPVRNPVHGEDGRMGYRQWVAMLYGDKDGLREPAKCVSFFIHDRKDDLPSSERSFRLTAAGYAMDNMKALAFVEGETPDLTIADAEAEVEQKCRDFVAAANNVAVALSRAVKLALYGEDAGIKTESTPLAVVRDRFWSDTNDQFFAILNDLSTLPAEAFVGEALSRRWLVVLERAALAIFDDVAPIQDILLRNFATKNGTVKNWLVDARRQLVRMLRGYGPRGVELFKNLQLPVPETKTKRSKRHDHPERSADGMGADRPTLVE